MEIYKPLVIWQQGRRENQEDSIYPAIGDATTDSRTFMVCDGMGGHEAGEVASGIVVDTISQYVEAHASQPFTSDILRSALQKAYENLKAHDSSNEARKMGTTLTFLHLDNEGAVAAHIGDSRIYQIRPTATGAEIIYKSSDHSLVNELVKAGVITEAEAANHPKRNVITRAMQPRDDHHDGATVLHTNDVVAGDVFLLCSDGVSGVVGDDQLIELWSNSSISNEVRMDLIASACAEKGHDNYSAYLVPIAEGCGMGTVMSQIEELTLDNVNAIPASDPSMAMNASVASAPQFSSPTTVSTSDDFVGAKHFGSAPVKNNSKKYLIAAVIVACLGLAILGGYMLFSSSDKEDVEDTNAVDDSRSNAERELGKEMWDEAEYPEGFAGERNHKRMQQQVGKPDEGASGGQRNVVDASRAEGSGQHISGESNVQNDKEPPSSSESLLKGRSQTQPSESDSWSTRDSRIGKGGSSNGNNSDNTGSGNNANKNSNGMSSKPDGLKQSGPNSTNPKATAQPTSPSVHSI
ncbi:MAG: protein phosphatase 2C domain-containing protein [Bacteroides sp.]|nr:protein phosphatase 2C domain-containing protein [Bacteroides sp.]MCM1413713.1 protein phosphatase 2C domain-containing protein [Bacteroides sp.]MCM1471892.1 protein phosphatase 2C domain-containing protein [Bacteroides sp.]